MGGVSVERVRDAHDAPGDLEGTHVGGHGADHGVGACEVGGRALGDAGVGGFEAVDAAVGGGDADGSAAVLGMSALA